MKFSLIRPASMLAMALVLASCGGGDDDDFTVAGSVEGIVYPGLVLTMNGADINVAPPAKAGEAVSFAFPNKLEYGDTYEVRVKTDPQHQNCAVHREAPLSYSGTAGQLAVINARFQCFIDEHDIGGTVTGLTKDNTGLVLANGSTTGTTLIVPAETNTTGAAFPYAMTVPVQYGQTYGVTIVTQPKDAVCTVQNPTGVMGDNDITNININCVRS
ncbi:hypothetical protein [Massilia sp. BSC265]|uniref:hypothetical protein n=1 Tax=Massilia sp. BSC265 TaxID=1549812 RepID=UPI0004E8DCB7|nr:hypothetical protein [Massilia sp. BSC265]KFI06116.1 hypothetical protein JN27_18630 [Massilia sp. BSC265]